MQKELLYMIYSKTMKINLSAILMLYLVGFLDIVISTEAYKVNK